MKLTREDFLKTSLAAAGALVGIGGAACGGDDGGGSGGGGSSSCSASITGNHGHTLSVAPADVEAGTAKTYSTSGGAHSHEVLVSNSHFASLKGGSSVSVTSSSAGSPVHTHGINITC